MNLIELKSNKSQGQIRKCERARPPPGDYICMWEEPLSCASPPSPSYRFAPLSSITGERQTKMVHVEHQAPHKKTLSSRKIWPPSSR
jgi:hypothetical protein